MVIAARIFVNGVFF